LSAINESLVQLNMKLGRIAVRQENMLVNLKKMTATVALTAIASPMSAPSRLLE
jgi:type II secretory pathway component PulM